MSRASLLQETALWMDTVNLALCLFIYEVCNDCQFEFASENNRHPAKMHRNNTAVVFFSRHIWSFPTFFRNLTNRTAPDIRHSGNRFGRLCLNLKNRDNR